MLCDDDWLFNDVARYCDFPDSVTCKGRPLCDANDENCVDRKAYHPISPA